MKSSEKQAAEAVAVILASYPQRNVNSADIYVRQLTLLLREYSPGVCKLLAHPVKGVVGRSKFLPSVAEVKAVADELAGLERVELAKSRPGPLPKPEPEVSEAMRRRIGQSMADLAKSLRSNQETQA